MSNPRSSPDCFPNLRSHGIELLFVRRFLLFYFNELLLQAKAELDETKRTAMYREMQELARDDGGTIIPVYAKYVFASRGNLAHGPLAANRDVDGWKSMERWWFKS